MRLALIIFALSISLPAAGRSTDPVEIQIIRDVLAELLRDRGGGYTLVTPTIPFCAEGQQPTADEDCVDDAPPPAFFASHAGDLVSAFVLEPARQQVDLSRFEFGSSDVMSRERYQRYPIHYTERLVREEPKWAGYLQLSLPVLTVDRNLALVWIRTNCGGLCGSVEWILLRNIYGAWIVVDRHILIIA